MSDHAYQTQYRQEFIAAFEQRQSLVRSTVTTEIELKGNTAIFLVAGSGGATAVTRGLNGLIPGRADSMTQNTCTLAEWHDKPVRTGFNLFASQGDGRRLMQETSMSVINRKIDDDIITALNTATLTTGVAQTGSLDLVTYVLAILGHNKVPLDGNISGLITPAFYSYLLRAKEFTNVDYVNNKPFESVQTMFRWAGVNFIVHSGLTGDGTAAEKCLFYHKTAIGHAIASTDISTAVGYNDEHDYSFARCSAFMGSALLQNSGIVVVTHDGSAFAAV